MLHHDKLLSTLETNRFKLIAARIRDIGLFGSYVHKEQTGKSDIDILMDSAPDKETFDKFPGSNELLKKLFRKNKIEVVTKNGLSPHIDPKILNEVQYV